MIPASYGHLADHRRGHRLPVVILCVQCFRLRRKNKNLKNRLPAKKAQNACRAVVRCGRGEIPAKIPSLLLPPKNKETLKPEAFASSCFRPPS